MNKKKIRGTGTAIVTPFTAHGEIDYEATRGLLDYQLSGGVDFLMRKGERLWVGKFQRRRKTEREIVAQTILREGHAGNRSGSAFRPLYQWANHSHRNYRQRSALNVEDQGCC